MNYYWSVKEIQPIQNKTQNKQPSNLEAEQALIGSVLVNNDVIDEVSSDDEGGLNESNELYGYMI